MRGVMLHVGPREIRCPLTVLAAAASLACATALAALVGACKDQAKESAAHAAPDAAVLADLVDKDVGEIERGLPAGRTEARAARRRRGRPAAGHRRSAQGARARAARGHRPQHRQVDLLRADRPERRRDPQRPRGGRDGGSEPRLDLPGPGQGERRLRDGDGGVPEDVGGAALPTKTGSRRRR